MGTYNASAYNDNHTLLKLIQNIQDYLIKNPNIALYYTTGFQGAVSTNAIPKDKVHGPDGSTNTPTVGDIILYAIDLGQGIFLVSGADDDNYTGEYIGQTIQGPQGPAGPEGPEGPQGDPGAAVYYATGIQGTVSTKSIDKDKVHGNVGRDPAIGDIILYPIDVGQGFFQISAIGATAYTGEYIGQTIQGPQGDPGTPGTDGKDGVAATVEVGDTTTGDATQPASVTNTGTASAAVFNFVIPRGEKGDKGDPGTGYQNLTYLSFLQGANDKVTYTAGLAIMTGKWQFDDPNGVAQIVPGVIHIPITAGNGITIDASEDDKSLVIKLATVSHTVASSLTYCESNNPATSVDDGTAYSATITADNGYTFSGSYTLMVMMGESDVTSNVTTVSGDTIAINIPTVTGDIDITCIAAAEIPRLATPTIAMNADGKTLEITDVENATSYDVYFDGTLKTNVAKPQTFTLTVSKYADDIYNGGLTYYKAGNPPTYSTEHDYIGSFELSEPTTIYIWTDSSRPQQKYWIDNNEYTTPVYPTTATHTVSGNTKIVISAGNIT